MIKIPPSLAGGRLPLTLSACFIAGGFASFAMAPTNFWPLLIVGLGYLYILLCEATTFRALLYTWFFCFGYFVIGLLWVSNALLGSNMPSVSSDLSISFRRASKARMRTSGTMRAARRRGSAAT